MTALKKRPQLDPYLKRPVASRCFLFYGPDDAGSRALASAVGAAVGDAERTLLGGRDCKEDPARLADEAASISLFGGARWIVVDPAGDDCVAAVEALLAAPVAGNPVVLVAGALKATSKLLKLVAGDPAGVAFPSYLPEGRDAERLVTDAGREEGLVIRADVARRIADASGGNRAVIALELRKYALFLHAAPDRTRTLEHEAVDALGADSDTGDLAQLIDAMMDGDVAAVDGELGRLASIGVESVTLTRAAQRRVMMLARVRAEMERGNGVDAAMASQAKGLFWKEQEPVKRQASRWTASLLAKAANRLVEAEAEILARGGLGPLAAEAEFIAICRQAARRR